MSGDVKAEQDEGTPEARVAASLADAQAGRLTRHASVQALMEHLEGEQETGGWVPPDGDMRPKAVTRQHEQTVTVPLSVCTEPKVDQSGPPETGEFTYIDISSVDNKLKLITEHKTLVAEAAPSRAKQRLKSNDVLVSMTRPNLNAVAIVPPELDGAVGSTGFHVLRATEGTEPLWLYYAVQTKGFTSAMSELVQGALYPAVRPKDIRAYEIPHPPLDQQKRIVAEIEKQFSRLDESVANLKRVKANLKRYKAAVLKAAVAGRLVETEAELARREGRSYETGAQLLQRILETRRSQWKGKGNYKEPAAPDTTDLPGLPEGWVYASIDQLLPPARDAMKTGPFGSLLKKHEHQDEGVPVLGIENIEAMRFVRGSRIHVSVKKADELSGYAVTTGDVLISRSGTVGEVCVVPNGLGEARISTNLMKVSLAKGGILPEFFVLLFNGSPFVLNQVSDLCKGSTRDFLNQEILRQLLFTCPPFSEQLRIAAEVDHRLSLIGEIEAQVDYNVIRTVRLRQSILIGAFSGRMQMCSELSGSLAA